jgi:Ca2+-binding EF-hand superfamily protein
MIVAHKSSTEEIGILRKLFQQYDTRRDGSISYDEFCAAMSEFGHSENDLLSMFEAVDLDGTGRIRYTEFLAATIEAQGAISEERLAEAFDRLDSDDSGYISAENLAEILGKDFPRDEIDEIIAEAGVTKDNRISYSEFLALWENKHERKRDAQLEMLEGTIQTTSSDIMMLSTRDSSSLLGDESDVAEETEAAASRATFIIEKHNTDKHVGFTDTIESIGNDDEVKQEILVD